MGYVNALYRPKGAALEYAPWACNLYLGCGHGCGYCYVPGALHMKPADWHALAATPRKNILASLQRDVEKKASEIGREEILLSFTSDPYHPGDTTVTRDALMIIGEAGLNATVLTKGGMRASRDFDLFQRYGFRVGVTLCSLSESYARQYEPHAAALFSRQTLLKHAHRDGIKTWVSMEPVIEPDHALDVLTFLMPHVDAWKIGKINHSKSLGVGVDWRAFVRKAQARLDAAGAVYQFKASLKKYM